MDKASQNRVFTVVNFLIDCFRYDAASKMEVQPTNRAEFLVNCGMSRKPDSQKLEAADDRLATE
jgi:hypothetical protein